MARTANVFARVEPEVKEQAEQVLDRLGIPMSNAVGMFLRQIVLQRGIPFEMKLPAYEEPVAYGSLTKEQFNAEIEKGMEDIRAGRVYSADEVEAEEDLNQFVQYLLFAKKNKQAAKNVLDDFEDTIKKLKNVASSLKVCDNPRLQSLGYRRINFQQHRYFMLYRIENDIASGRIAEVRSRSMSCNYMTRTSQQECRGILES